MAKDSKRLHRPVKSVMWMFMHRPFQVWIVAQGQDRKTDLLHGAILDKSAFAKISFFHVAGPHRLPIAEQQLSAWSVGPATTPCGRALMARYAVVVGFERLEDAQNAQRMIVRRFAKCRIPVVGNRFCHCRWIEHKRGEEPDGAVQASAELPGGPSD
jgi:hypothetical protein